MNKQVSFPHNISICRVSMWKGLLYMRLKIGNHSFTALHTNCRTTTISYIMSSFLIWNFKVILYTYALFLYTCHKICWVYRYNYTNHNRPPFWNFFFLTTTSSAKNSCFWTMISETKKGLITQMWSSLFSTCLLV